MKFWIVCSFLIIYVTQVLCEDIEPEKYITCGSAIRITSSSKTSKSKYYLYSNNQNWSYGSGQQIVTFDSNKESTSLWTVQESFSQQDNNICLTGTPLKCNQIIRLQHVMTNKYLHSHSFRAPLSGEQEVSAFGASSSSDENLKNTQSDKGDNWRVECIYSNESKNSNDYWQRNQRIQLKHVSTQKYLSMSPTHKYTDANCPHCPIVGHWEAFTKTSGDSNRSANTVFRVEDGVHLFQ